MADLSKITGKKVLWAGSNKDEEELTTHYILFDGGLCFAFGDDGSLDLLADGADTLEQILNRRIEEAHSILELDKALKSRAKPKHKAEEPEVESEPSEDPSAV